MGSSLPLGQDNGQPWPPYPGLCASASGAFSLAPCSASISPPLSPILSSLSLCPLSPHLSSLHRQAGTRIQGPPTQEKVGGRRSPARRSGCGSPWCVEGLDTRLSQSHPAPLVPWEVWGHSIGANSISFPFGVVEVAKFELWPGPS